MSRLILAAFLVLFGVTGQAATYMYQGPTFASASGVYNTSMRISGSINTANPLPANMPPTDIGPSGSNLIQSWNLSDGVNTYTPANSYIVPGLTSFSTDANGNVTANDLGIFSPLPPHSISDPINGVQISSSYNDAAAIGAPCMTLYAGTICQGADGSSATGGFAQTATSSTFILQAAVSVPSLSEWGVLGLSSLLALGTLCVLRRKIR